MTTVETQNEISPVDENEGNVKKRPQILGVYVPSRIISK